MCVQTMKFTISKHIYANFYTFLREDQFRVGRDYCPDLDTAPREGFKND
jgi:hypothetical protein